LEDLSDSIVQDFVYMRQREEEMRDTNGINKFIVWHFLIGFLKFRLFLIQKSSYKLV
jgi:hypothetical protein